MAKEADLKKIELKVSVNCCDGCKKKVKKVLRSIEGVLKTEIDPLQPKVTVLGNVNPQILIKKLLKAGKQAEMWSHEKVGKEKKDAEISKCGCEQGKCQGQGQGGCGTSSTDKSKEYCRIGGGGKQESNKDQKEMDSSTTSSSHREIKKENSLPLHPEVNCNICPSMLHDTGNVRTYTQYCYMVEPCSITLPYYSIRSYAPPPLPPCNNTLQELYHERSVPSHSDQPPLLQTPTTQVGDYFSDENTVGCYVM